jgi:hypothetical protein
MTGALSAAAPWVHIENTGAARTRAQNAQKLWLKRQLSTLSYLLVVNAAGSRTAADLTQYPVLPWVLNDYGGAAVDLDSPAAYRDLSKPVGATNAQRSEEVVMRYNEWCDDMTPPFHHGTHYSSSAIVMYYLVRLQPFTRMSARYQGGRLDVADRLFHSVAEAWASSSGPRGGDAKELIPEMFLLPELFANANGAPLGTKRDGTELGAVVVPPWAGGSAHKFVAMHRAALESEHAGRGLHGWIDLIFGVKQTGEDAIAAVNTFHHVSYERGLQAAMESEGSSEEERKAIVAQVDNFGLTPRVVFKAAHGKRSAAPILAKQQQFVAALASLQTRFVSFTQRHPRAAADGGATTLREVDSSVLVSTRRHLYPAARPQQCIEWRGHYDIAVRSKEDTLVSAVPSVAGFGAGRVTVIECSASGNILCVGTLGGVVFVYVRRGTTRPFELEHVLRCGSAAELGSEAADQYCATAVTSLRLLANGILVAVINGHIVVAWHVTVLQQTHRFTVDLRRVTSSARGDEDSVDASDVVDCCVDAADEYRSGQLFVVKEWSVVLLSRAGGVLAVGSLRGSVPLDGPATQVTSPTQKQRPSALASLRALAALEEPFTAVCSMPFATYSPTNVLLCGHADGSVTAWDVTAIIDPAVEATVQLRVAHVVPSMPLSESGQSSAVTALIAQTERSFSAAFENGNVLTFVTPGTDTAAE